MPVPAYRDIYYPLNVFMHILTREEGSVAALHYGFFERDGESMRKAQERATEMLLERLPPPPARILDAGSGLGSTLQQLLARGYDAVGITPDAKQIEIMPVDVPVRCARFEELEPSPYDAILFQESSQYIGAAALFAKAREMTSHVIVFDEFALQAAPLHRYDEFMAAAAANGFEKIEETDFSRQAAPSVDYFNKRFERYRDSLMREIGLTAQQIDELIAGGIEYRDRYASGAYVYRGMQFRR